MNTLGIKSLLKTEHSLNYHLELAWVRLRPLTIPTLAGGTLALGAVSGLLATELPFRKVGMLLAGPVVFFVALSRPELVILLKLVISLGIVRNRSIQGFGITELCLMLLLGLVMARSLSNRGKGAFVRTPLDLPILLFFVASFISYLNAKYNLGTQSLLLLYAWRAFSGYLVFFAVTNLLRTQRQLMTLVGSMLVMATILAALMIAQQVVGPSASIIPGKGGVGTATALGRGFSDVARVAIPGSALVCVMLFPAFILYITPEHMQARKWLSLIPVVLLPLAIAFTFTRSMWIGTVVSSAIFIIITRSQSKKFVLLIVVGVIVASLLVSLLGVYFPRVDSIVEALSLRAGSLFAGDELLYDGSTQWRLRENELAIAKVKEYPLLGVGPGGEYRHPWWNGDTLTHYMHNGYLYLLTDVGIVGFLPFFWFSIVYLFRGFSSWRTIQDPVLKGLVIGFTLSYIAVLSSNTTSPRLLEANYIPLLGVMLGVNEVAIRLAQQPSQ
jgi:O-antigen ligase